ncbi:MAG: VWA domain-containing protein [Bryobacteraceae bacterium]
MRLLNLLLFPALLMSQTPEPVIRVTTRLVTVSVVVRSKGHPVTDLTARDFEVFDRAKSQKIAFFAMNSAVSATSAATQKPKNVFTNRGEAQPEAPSTATVLLVDGLNTEFQDQAFARDHLRRFLAGMNPSERIAIYALGRRLNVIHDFSDDRDHLAKIVEHFRGEIVGESITPENDLGVIQMLDKLDTMKSADKNEQVYREGLRVQRTIAALDAIANHLAKLPGRKNLIWISGSFPIYPGFQVVTRKFETSRQRSFTEQVARTTRLFSDANMAIYPVDVRGMFSTERYGADGQYRMRRSQIETIQSPFHADNRDAMKMLADGTGGVMFKDTNDLGKALRQAIEDAQVTYTLGFYPDQDALDGKYHELSVKVARKGIDVRHRNGYMAVKDTALGAEERKAMLRDTLWSPLDASSIEIVARADAHDGSVDLALSINPETFTLEQKQDRWVGGLDVYLSQCDTQGKELETTRDTVDLNLTAGRYAARQSNWLAMAKTVRPKPEAIELRVIVQDRPTGVLGSVRIPLSRLKK